MMTESQTLSEDALRLLRLHFGDDGPRVDEDNRDAYRELGRAGLMEPLHSFAWGRESNYRLTRAAVERKAEFLIEDASTPTSSR